MAEAKLSKPSYLEGNSKTDAEAAATPITQGQHDVKQIATVTVKKKPAAKRLRESLGLEETRTVGDYLVWDVLLPSAKDMLADLVKKGIDVFLYGGTSQSPSRKAGRGHVSYDGYYSAKRRDEIRKVDVRNRYVHDFSSFVFPDRQMADIVLSEMCECIDNYDFVKVSDFYSMVGETERSNFTDHSFGWDNLSTATIERTRDGYVLDLPKPIKLN